MTAGDIGALLVFNPGTTIPPGAVAVIIVQAQTEPLPVASIFPALVSTDGLTITYLTTGIEFPQGGKYKLACRYSGAGYLFTSPSVTETIGENL